MEVGKWLIREILYKYIPKDLIERPKVGSAVPVSQWMCGPLREWADDLLRESRIQREGYLILKWLERFRVSILVVVMIGPLVYGLS